MAVLNSTKTSSESLLKIATNINAIVDEIVSNINIEKIVTGPSFDNSDDIQLTTEEQPKKFINNLNFNIYVDKK